MMGSEDETSEEEGSQSDVDDTSSLSEISVDNVSDEDQISTSDYGDVGEEKNNDEDKNTYDSDEQDDDDDPQDKEPADNFEDEEEEQSSDDDDDLARPTSHSLFLERNYTRGRWFRVCDWKTTEFSDDFLQAPGFSYRANYAWYGKQDVCDPV
ncbi:glutamic acid-rich protein-like [Neocloeon triangulifer]|uniref:glutamic acid-rich protein-like n=1 Tax=Neocloeon triangulifer TaxID=2078957 RepID=UPI00286EDF69|nr:glutamic acid-rich protein-like [Neocloeon triangulifer]